MGVLSQRTLGLVPAGISRDVGLEEATILRLLAALEARGAVERDRRAQTYTLGRRLIGYISSYFAKVDLHSA